MKKNKQSEDISLFPNCSEMDYRTEKAMDWISDNKERLVGEYLDLHEDDFNEFCKVAYEHEGKD